MKRALSIAVGIGIGDAIYQTMRHGVHGIDWVKVGFMFAFSALLLAIVPKPKPEK